MISLWPWLKPNRSIATPASGLEQAREYAQILGLSFAYSTNDEGIVEFDFITGRERELESFPSPDELRE